jgi:hypothetical protein
LFKSFQEQCLFPSATLLHPGERVENLQSAYKRMYVATSRVKENLSFDEHLIWIFKENLY